MNKEGVAPLGVSRKPDVKFACVFAGGVLDKGVVEYAYSRNRVTVWVN